MESVINQPSVVHSPDFFPVVQWDTKTDRARRYKVVLHNDDFTTMEFVVAILIKFFHKTETEANYIMLSVHHKGVGVAGIYTKDIAHTKVKMVEEYSRDHEMPLKLSIEPE